MLYSFWSISLKCKEAVLKPAKEMGRFFYRKLTSPLYRRLKQELTQDLQQELDHINQAYQQESHRINQAQQQELHRINQAQQQELHRINQAQQQELHRINQAHLELQGQLAQRIADEFLVIYRLALEKPCQQDNQITNEIMHELARVRASLEKLSAQHTNLEKEV
jgi:hypothetical protein